jgi:hypothetical protein
VLAHAGGAPETLSIILLFGGIWIGWAGWSRVKSKGFPRMPIRVAYGLLGVAVALALLAGFLPQAIWGASGRPSPPPPASGARPTSTATVEIVQPSKGEKVSGNQLEVVMTLAGGTIVDAASTRLTPDTGHIHLSLDGRLASMTYGLVQFLPNVSPGRHTLEAEFVAADHGPFDPRVTATVTFTQVVP